MKRNGFPALPADYRRPRGPEIDRPSDFRISGRSRGFATRAGRPGGNLANWKPEIQGVCAAPTGRHLIAIVGQNFLIGDL
jgi:hypothetical protein